MEKTELQIIKIINEAERICMQDLQEHFAHDVRHVVARLRRAGWIAGEWYDMYLLQRRREPIKPAPFVPRNIKGDDTVVDLVIRHFEENKNAPCYIKEIHAATGVKISSLYSSLANADVKKIFKRPGGGWKSISLKRDYQKHYLEYRAKNWERTPLVKKASPFLQKCPMKLSEIAEILSCDKEVLQGQLDAAVYGGCMHFFAGRYSVKK